MSTNPLVASLTVRTDDVDLLVDKLEGCVEDVTNPITVRVSPNGYVTVSEVLAHPAEGNEVAHAYESVSKLIAGISGVGVDQVDFRVSEADYLFSVEDGRARLPEIVGIAEVADILGVSRQRASKLNKDGRLPSPIATVSATPLFDAKSIRAFNADRDGYTEPEQLSPFQDRVEETWRRIATT